MVGYSIELRSSETFVHLCICASTVHSTRYCTVLVPSYHVGRVGEIRDEGSTGMWDVG